MLKNTRFLVVFALLLLVFGNFALGDQERQSKEQEKEWGKERYEEGEQGKNPYVLQEHHFRAKVESPHGRVRVLPKFTEWSNLLRGIENYRLSILEAEPQTFVIPNHWDAEAVVFVVQGQGSLSLVHRERRESFNIRRGDVIRIPSGTTVYLINKDNSQKLIAAKLLQPVFSPGEFETFFGAGGQEPESFYRSFSIEILEAALKAKRERIEAVLGQQRRGPIIKASQEQIRALSQHEQGGIWPFGGESKGLINIFQKGPSHSNQYGQLYEVNQNDYRPLYDVNVAVSFANVTQGNMEGLFYNSRSTKISLVIRGEGELQITCPHLSSQSEGRRGPGSQQGQGEREGRQGSQQGQEEREGRQGSQEERGERERERGESTGTPHYQRVSARLRPYTAFVVPPGHPYVVVASKRQNLEVLCFEIFSFGNEKVPVAGRRNVIKRLEKEAKELSFGVSSRIVDEVFGNEEDEFLFKGPAGGREQQQQQEQEEGRADA